MRGTIGNPRFVGDVRSHVGLERDGLFHWYGRDGYRYAHCWRGGRDWFGFYVGPVFFWSVWANNYFWWHEVAYDRWLWYSDGNWWWYGPGGLAYIYYEDQYYPWNAAPITVVAPAYPGDAPVDAGDAPTPGDTGSAFTSPDGSRMVRVEGAEANGFLYDMTKSDARGNAVFLRWLGAGVTDVQFSNTQPLQISVQLDVNGQTATVPLDADGNRLDAVQRQAAPIVPSGSTYDATSRLLGGMELAPMDMPGAPVPPEARAVGGY